MPLEDIVTFGPEFQGQGFYDYETARFPDGGVIHYRWTSARPEARFRFIGYSHSLIEVELNVTNVIAPELIAGLKIAVDGNAVRPVLESTNGGKPYTLRFVTKRQTSSPFSEISIRSDRSICPARQHGSGDSRDLVLALHGMRVRPADERMAQAQLKEGVSRHVLDLSR